MTTQLLSSRLRKRGRVQQDNDEINVMPIMFIIHVYYSLLSLCLCNTHSLVTGISSHSHTNCAGPIWIIIEDRSLVSSLVAQMERMNDYLLVRDVSLVSDICNEDKLLEYFKLRYQNDVIYVRCYCVSLCLVMSRLMFLFVE